MMPALMGQHISLMPDATVAAQLAIFLFILLVLYFFIFKPVLKILDLRRHKTTELEKDAERKIAQASAMEKKYKEQIAAAEINGARIEQDLLSKGDNEAREIILKAKEEANKTVSQWRTKAKSQSESAKTELDKKIDDFTNIIVEKVLGPS